MTPSNDVTERPPRPKLLAWHWLMVACSIFTIATSFAWIQTPRQVPPLRGELAMSLLHPGEKNPHRRLLSVLDNLRWIGFDADRRRGWAVGDRELVLVTADGGANWRKLDGASAEASTARQNSAKEAAGVTILNVPMPWAHVSAPYAVPVPPGDANTSFTMALFHPNRLHAWALADDGTIFKTDDGAKRWTRLPSPTGQVLKYIDVASDFLHGWAVGESGTILQTADGGKTWSPQTSTSQPALNDIWVSVDGRRAWAVGDGGTIVTTVDQGRSWQPQPSNVTANLRAVTFAPDGVRGWATGEGGVIIATTDGGKKWSRQTSNSTSPIAAISFSANGVDGWTIDEAGKRNVTSNGGASWQGAKAAEPAMRMSSVGFSADGTRGWALGVPTTMDGLFGPRLYTTDTAGQTWAPANANASVGLRSASVDPTGTRILAISGPGMFKSVSGDAYNENLPLVFVGGAKSWQIIDSDVARGLYAVKLAADGRAWAVGKGGRIVISDDGGQHWSDAEKYSRYPAPWYWLAVLFSTLLAAMSWRKRPAVKAKESVADVAASDAEVRLPAGDRLNFGGLARGISRFLRNVATQPPLTMAISGDWGSGKSSLMHLVCADLRRFGHRPIWFNAWHHQKEEHLFAALLGAIYAQAVPPLPSLNGIAFRLRLLWLRSWKHFGVMMTVIAVVTSLSILSMQAFAAGGLPNLTSAVGALRERAAPLLGSIAAVVAAVTAFYTLIQATTAFGANPALLLSATKDHMSLKSATAHNDFRDRFARQFDELTKALPYRLVIVVDDLDRCHPAAVVEVMEAVNYLTSAGKCFVLFGMARERVQAALGLAFKDIAAEMVNMDASAQSTDADRSADPARERAKRRAYAVDYLQKLVNIEIQVPTSGGPDPHRLLVAPDAAPRSQVGPLIETAVRLLPLIAAGGALTLGVWMAQVVGEAAGKTRPPTVASSLAPAVPPSPVVVAPARSPASEAAVNAPSDRIGDSYEVHAGDRANLTQGLGWMLMGLSPMLVVVAAIGVLLMRKNLYETRDSTRFHQALEIWTPVVAAKRATPRAIKRFGNRLRYLAMLQQGEEKDETVLDLFEEKLRQLVHRESPPQPAAAQRASSLFEHQLIALGALHEIWGEQWKEKIRTTFYPHWSESDHPTTSGNDGPSLMREAALAHQRKFGTAWPPSSKEMEAFERLISGVRLAGDPRPIVPQTAALSASETTPA